jgi:hypothetical protein
MLNFSRGGDCFAALTTNLTRVTGAIPLNNSSILSATSESQPLLFALSPEFCSRCKNFRLRGPCSRPRMTQFHIFRCIVV